MWSELRAKRLSTRVYPTGPNVGIAAAQDKQWRESGTRPFNDATHGHFAWMFNILDGVIVASDIDAPTDRLERDGDPLPPSALVPGFSWADATFVMWARTRPRMGSAKRFPFATSTANDRNPYAGMKEWSSNFRLLGGGAMRGWLNFIIMSNIPPREGDDTTAIVMRCLQSRSFYIIPDWALRKTYPVGHWCFYALLATQSGKDVVWLLAQHQDAENGLGHKAIGSVTIYATDDPLYTERPTLMWHIVDFEQAWPNVRDRVEALWLPQGAPNDQYDYPNVEWSQNIHRSVDHVAMGGDGQQHAQAGPSQ